MTAPDPNRGTYQVGDKVRIVSSACPDRVGMTGRVSGIDARKWFFPLWFTSDDGSFACLYSATALAPLTDTETSQ